MRFPGWGRVVILALWRRRPMLRHHPAASLILLRVVVGLAILAEPLSVGAQEPSPWRDPQHGCTYILSPHGGIGLRYRRDGSPDCPAALPNSPDLNCWLFDAGCLAAGAGPSVGSGFERPSPSTDNGPDTAPGAQDAEQDGR